ncbi:hypothetical protein ACSSS7_007264 [Eimeria intestinalis]
MSRGVSPSPAPVGGRQREVRKPATSEASRKLDLKEAAGALKLSEDMLSALARASRDIESNAVGGGGSSTTMGSPASSAACPPTADFGRAAPESDGELAAAIEKYRSGSFFSQQASGRRQQANLTGTQADSASAALLCSEVDLACLRDGVQASAEGFGGLRLGSLEASATVAEGLDGSIATDEGRPNGQLIAGTNLAALQTAMADFAAAERAQYGADSGVFCGSAPSRRAAHLGGASSRGASTPHQDVDILSSSLFTKLLSECRSSGCDLTGAGGERQGRDSAAVKSDSLGRGSALSPELLALLQHHLAVRLQDKSAGSKRLLASISGSSCSSSINSRRTSSCSPGAEADGSEEARFHKRRILGHMLEQHRTNFARNNRISGGTDLKALAASLASAREGDIMDALSVRSKERKERKPGQEHGGRGDSPPSPLSPSYLAELQLIERVANGDPALFNADGLGGSPLRGPLGYYSVCEAVNKEEATPARLYPVVRGVSRDNTKKRWAVYWKGYRRYFYDKFFESCVEAYRRAVQFRQQATTAAAAVAATGNPAHLIAAGLHGSPGGPGHKRQQVKGETPETVAAVLASAAAAVAGEGKGEELRMKLGSNGACTVVSKERCQDNDRTTVCLYKEAILFVLDDLRNNVLSEYLTSRAAATINAAASAVPHAANVELAAATTAKRLLDQLLLVHSNLVGNATSTAELQPSLMIVAPCLEDLKLPSQQTSQQQLQLLQSILAMHIQQLLLLSRYLNKGEHSISEETCEQKPQPATVKAEVGQTELPGPDQEEPQDSLVATASSESAVDVHA